MMGFAGMWWWLIIIIAILFVVLHVARNVKQSDSENSISSVSAMDILKMRLARGELSKDDFEKLKTELLK